MTVDGQPIHVNLDDERGRRLVASNGNFNPHSLTLWNLALSLRNWSMVVDVGANYGEMLVGARLPAGAVVKAFEPNAAILEHLLRTLDDAGLAVEVFPLAVGAEPGTVDFAIDTQWSGSSTLAGAGALVGDRWRHEHVEVTTIDAIVGTESTPCIKVDVEGHEFDVLRGARELHRSDRPWVMMLEVLHLSAFEVSRLAERHPLYMLDIRTERLVRVIGGNPMTVRRVVESSWLYGQDALIVHESLLDKESTAV